MNRSPHFESGENSPLVKIQDGQEKEMTTDEQLDCKTLQIEKAHRGSRRRPRYCC